MKNASFVKNNKSKINSSHPYSFKEINSTPNYLYMQIKNGLYNNKRPNGKSPKGSNSSLKNFQNHIPILVISVTCQKQSQSIHFIIKT